MIFCRLSSTYLGKAMPSWWILHLTTVRLFTGWLEKEAVFPNTDTVRSLVYRKWGIGTVSTFVLSDKGLHLSYCRRTWPPQVSKSFQFWIPMPLPLYSGRWGSCRWLDWFKERFLFLCCFSVVRTPLTVPLVSMRSRNKSSLWYARISKLLFDLNTRELQLFTWEIFKKRLNLSHFHRRLLAVVIIPTWAWSFKLIQACFVKCIFLNMRIEISAATLSESSV